MWGTIFNYGCQFEVDIILRRIFSEYFLYMVVCDENYGANSTSYDINLQSVNII